jgi:hypothetical protein
MKAPSHQRRHPSIHPNPATLDQGIHVSEDVMQKDINLGWRFWIVFLALCMMMLLSALDATIAATALLTITRELN